MYLFMVLLFYVFYQYHLCDMISVIPAGKVIIISAEMQRKNYKNGMFFLLQVKSTNQF